MTIDSCPFISNEEGRGHCPGCAFEKTAPTVPDQAVIVDSCLGSIRREIGDASGKPDRERSVIGALAKLKRLTSFEEEPTVDVKQRKDILDILALIEKNKPALDHSRELDYQNEVSDVLFNVGEYQRVQDILLALSEAHPYNKRVWNNLGVTTSRMDNDVKALEYYDRALEVDATYGSAWFNKGKALFRLGMKKKALECFRKATWFSPENKSAWNNLGVTLRQLKRYSESIKCYDEALKIHSEYPWAWYNKGVALMELKRYKQAMQCFDRALRIDSNYEPARVSKKELMRKLM